MGKTKTAVISGVTDEVGKSSVEKLKEKKEKQALEANMAQNDSESLDDTQNETNEDETSNEKTKAPKARGKKYAENKAKVDKNKEYSLKEAIKLVKETSYSKFDGTVEIHMVVKKVGTSVQVELPFSAGKKRRVEIADDRTIEKLKEGKVDFDILLSTTEMMPKLVPFAKILGPKGLMPNPKNGTIIKSKKDAEKHEGNTITIKTERKQPVIHTSIGKVSQSEKELIGNIEEIVKRISSTQITKAVLSSTMGPGIKIKVS